MTSCAFGNHAVQVVPFRSRGGLERQPRRCHSFAVRCNVKIEKPGASGYAVEGNRPTSPKVSDVGYYWILGDFVLFVPASSRDNSSLSRPLFNLRRLQYIV